jgi:hypothetical protein
MLSHWHCKLCGARVGPMPGHTDDCRSAPECCSGTFEHPDAISCENQGCRISHLMVELSQTLQEEASFVSLQHEASPLPLEEGQLRLLLVSDNPGHSTEVMHLCGSRANLVAAAERMAVRTGGCVTLATIVGEFHGSSCEQGEGVAWLAAAPDVLIRAVDQRGKHFTSPMIDEATRGTLITIEEWCWRRYRLTRPWPDPPGGPDLGGAFLDARRLLDGTGVYSYPRVSRDQLLSLLVEETSPLIAEERAAVRRLIDAADLAAAGVAAARAAGRAAAPDAE